MSGRGLSLAAGLLLVGGCASDGSSGSVHSPTPSASSGSESSAVGEAAIPIQDALIAQLTLVGDPDWMAADDNGVWVQLGSGVVTLIDPATNKPSLELDIGDIELCQGIGASFGSVWTCLRSDVVRIDPETGSVVSTFAVKKQALQGHLVGGFGHVWILTGDGSGLVGIDPESNRPTVEYRLPARGVDVAMSDDALWVPCRIDDRVLKIDPATGEVLLDIEVANPVAVAADPDEVWVGTASDTQRLDPDTGDVLVVADAPAEPNGSIALDATSVWVRNADDFLLQIDRSSGARVATFTAEGVTSGGNVLTLGNEVWVSAYDDQLVFRLDPSAIDRG